MTLTINIDGIPMEITEERYGDEISTQISAKIRIGEFNFCMQQCLPMGTDIFKVLLSAKLVAKKLKEKMND